MVNVYNILIGQDDCPHTLITSHVPGLIIYVMNTSDDANNYQKTFSIFISKNKEDLKAALDELKNYPNIRDLDLLGRKENMMSLIYSFPKTSAFRNVRKLGFRMHPVVIRNGQERWFFVSDAHDLLTRGKTLLNDHVTRLLTIKRLTTNEFINAYTKLFNSIWKMKIDSQTGGNGSEIISEALKAGYYDWPRQSNLSELSKSINVPRTTLTYKIRKLEKKVFSELEESDA